VSEAETRVAPPAQAAPEPRRLWDTLVGKPRTPDDLARDPALLFNASHLAGAVDAFAFGLVTRKEPISVEEARELGEWLAGKAAWFYEDAKPSRQRR
jgi:hypothetical protein